MSKCPLICPYCGNVQNAFESEMRNGRREPNTFNLSDLWNPEWLCSVCNIWVSIEDEEEGESINE